MCQKKLGKYSDLFLLTPGQTKPQRRHMGEQRNNIVLLFHEAYLVNRNHQDSERKFCEYRQLQCAVSSRKGDSHYTRTTFGKSVYNVCPISDILQTYINFLEDNVCINFKFSGYILMLSQFGLVLDKMCLMREITCSESMASHPNSLSLLHYNCIKDFYFLCN